MSVTEYLKFVQRLDRFETDLLALKALVEQVISAVAHDRKKNASRTIDKAVPLPGVINTKGADLLALPDVD